MHKFDLKMRFWERSAYHARVINFLKTYRNVIIVPAAMAMLLEQCNGREQSSWATSVSSTAIKLRCHPHWPWCWPPTHSRRYLHLALGLHQSYTHLTQRPPTVRFCSAATVPRPVAATLAHARQRVTRCIMTAQ